MLGGGPVGLAAAANLSERDLPFVVLEARSAPGASVRAWGHVQMFSPWRYNIDPAARRLLIGSRWAAPREDVLPTGRELVEEYLEPLAQLPAMAAHIRYGARVAAITRLDADRVRTFGRQQSPFLIRLGDGTDVLASAIIDASGTWRTPNVLGANGLPAHGESDAAQFVDHALPDVLGADRGRFSGRHTLVVGAGHSAANTLLALVELAETERGTAVTWALRGGSPDRAFGGGDADALPARGALGSRVQSLVNNGRITLATGFGVHKIEPAGHRVRVIGRSPRGVERELVVDRVVSATGFRPDHSIAAELRLDLDPILGCTRALAPLIDPNEHSCGTVRPHGVDDLAHAELGYWTAGMKSYGRAPTFLLATGYEQVRSITAALADDWVAARELKLDLPETGVCSATPTARNARDATGAPPARDGDGAGIERQRATTTLSLTTVGGCCG